MDKSLFQSLKAPFLFLDIQSVERNIENLKKRSGHLKIRIASKSIRCTHVLDYLVKHPSGIFEGIMCFYPDEALMLMKKGFKNLLIAYPYVREATLSELVNEINDEEVYFMVDHQQQLEKLNELAQKTNKKLKICLDVDLSVRLPAVYFGVYRSSINSLEKAKSLVDSLDKYENLSLKSVMGYEAQFAGVGDANPFQKILNFPVKLLQKYTWSTVVRRRVAIVDYIKSKGIKLDFVNGGGTGSLHLTKTDPSVTELAAGSGIYAPGLFDYYSSFHLKPAMGFALEVTRNPSEGVYTMAGGGYIASGALSGDKHPKPWNVNEMKMIKEEGFGEVQTPFHALNKTDIGDLKFFRHAKAGELCERFNSIWIINGNDLKEVPTYRGEGFCYV